MTASACLLCGNPKLSEVRVSLVEWADPIEAQRFGAVPRCVDRKSCRERVEANGETWEVREVAK